MIVRIKVWDRSGRQPRHAGDMVCEIAENGRMQSAFRYDRNYLQARDAFTLDPVSLPLKADSFTTGHPGMFGVFEDSLPDDWGRALLIRKNRIPRHEQTLPHLLLALGGAGLGALSFSDHEMPEPPARDVSVLQLSVLVEAAGKYERGEVRDQDIPLLLSAGSSPGGARPKALVWDEADDIHYLAKFPSVKDQVDVVRLEAATMILAEKAGLDVPPTRLVPCASNPVLLVRRFDVMGAERRHMISMQTLLGAHGYYQHRYADMLGIIRKYSRDPQADAGRLYRQMVFNAVMGNTDDHLKNFLMVHDTHDGWRLSPAFDLVPDLTRRGEHVLFFDLDAHYPGRRKLEEMGKRWAIPHSVEIVEQVFDAVAGWKEEFARSSVPDGDIIRFREIDGHLAK